MAARLMDVLVQQRVITPEQAQAALNCTTPGESPVQQLISSGQISEEELVVFFSRHFAIPTVKLVSINPQALKLVPLETILKFRCLPFQIDPDGKTVRVAVADPSSLAQIEALKAMLMRNVVPVLTSFSTLETFLKKISESAQSVAKTQQQSIATGTAGTSSLGVRRFKAQDQVLDILNRILAEAVSKGASDIHLEPQPDRISVRLRFEGVLFDVYEIPIELKEQLSNRVKVTTGLDISERRVPQDGRARIKIGNAEINFRTSIMPSIYGETIVFRVLRQADLQLGIEKLGFDPQQFAAFKRGIEAPNGMLLVTGSTGSGKTSTLYSALASLNKRSVKIATVEDPVEYSLPGITQVQVNKDAGLDFAGVLKSLLRQDPDIILVGEIRDQETAAIAIQAALTGHLVLSSLHTNDAASAVLRLLNMKAEPFAVLAAINTVVAQRLVRKTCTACVEPTKITEEQLKWLGPDKAMLENHTFTRGRGCDNCLGGGYRGRRAIFEVLELDQTLKEMFLKGDNVINVKRHAISSGMKTLRQSALALVAAGVTTLEEAIASTAE